ncbi:MAG: metallophosphatase family protein, partial [Acidobacteria bacterium]|nr:metallophosphatase family protein [Acidobacteriota bacterium]
LHAGDIGGEEILEELRSVAPVTAVSGNTDGFPLVSTLKASETLEFQPERIVLTHQIGHPERLYPEASDLVKEFRATLVVFGHTHSPLNRVVRGVRFLNPGAAGPRRFSLPRTVALLEVGPTESAQVQFVPLDETSEALFKGGTW